MATLAEKKAAIEQAQRKARQRSMLAWLAIIPIILILLLALRFGPRAIAEVATITNPSPRTDVEVFELLDNSKSVTSLDPKAKIGLANDACSVVAKTSQLLGTVRVVILRMGHTVVDLPDAPYDSAALLNTLKHDYIDAGYDPEDGTYLAQALDRVDARATPGATLVISVGSTSWDDSAKVRSTLAELKRNHKIILLIHGATVHNVVTNKQQMDLCGAIKEDVKVLGSDARVASLADFSDAVERWLPERLKANHVRLVGE